MSINVMNTADLVQGGVKILTYGASGAGKTTLIKTLPNPITLSAEGGLLSVKDAGLPYIQISDMDMLTEAYIWLMESQEAQQYESVALDSISEIAARHMVRCRIRWAGLSAHFAISPTGTSILPLKSKSRRMNWATFCIIPACPA